MNTKKLSVTMPEEIILKVKKMAKDEDRSFSKMVSILVSEAIIKKAA